MSKHLSKAEILAQKALARFRPRKSDARKFVFISTEGKPLPKGTSRKGLMVYVKMLFRGPRGGKLKVPRLIPELVREKPRAKIVPRRIGSFDLGQTRHKRAAEAFHGKPRHESRLEVLRQGMTPVERRNGVNFLRFTQRLAADLDHFIQGGGRGISQRGFAERGSFLIHVRFITSDLREYDFQVQFQQRAGQGIGREGYEESLYLMCWKNIALLLREHRMVSAGSAAHIRSLRVNRGEAREDWMDGRNRPWDKKDFETIKIVRMEYRISRITR